MSAAPLVLPNVRAHHIPELVLTPLNPYPEAPADQVTDQIDDEVTPEVEQDQCVSEPEVFMEGDAQAAQAAPVAAGIPFYRKYTEGLLRRYLRCSMEAGKVPSLLGKEMFRSKVSHYRMESFEDIIIFICDVERCISRLDDEQQQFIARIALQQYTVLEIAAELHLNPKTVVRLYNEALDDLTRIFLAVEILHPQNDVKGANSQN